MCPEYRDLVQDPEYPDCRVVREELPQPHPPQVPLLLVSPNQNVTNISSSFFSPPLYSNKLQCQAFLQERERGGAGGPVEGGAAEGAQARRDRLLKCLSVLLFLRFLPSSSFSSSPSFSLPSSTFSDIEIIVMCKSCLLIYWLDNYRPFPGLWPFNDFCP